VAEIPDYLRHSIQTLYRDFLESKNLKPRLGQKQMIAEVARILARIGDKDGPPIGFIEAGTGTGKTLAYLVGAVPYAMEREMQLVISTATVSLQSQLIDKDIPELTESTDLMLSFALAKGRRRYLCPIRLEARLRALLKVTWCILMSRPWYWIRMIVTWFRTCPKRGCEESGEVTWIRFLSLSRTLSKQLSLRTIEDVRAEAVGILRSARTLMNEIRGWMQIFW